MGVAEANQKVLQQDNSSKQANGAASDSSGSAPSSPVRANVDESTIPRRLHSSGSVDLAVAIDVKNEAKVLVLYTGGTIGMVRNAEGVLAPEPNALEQKIRSTSGLHDEDYAVQRFHNPRDVGHSDKPAMLPFVLPFVPEHRRVIYCIYEYDPLLDSSNMTMDDWIQVASDIECSYELFDGFVILHGTDTLAYTASALSFMLENLGKPVIITGSQIPCFETRSDGRDNLVGALILAGNYNIPEVAVYFRQQLLRGNRTVKLSAGDMDAFHSPNMSPLVKIGIDIQVDYKSIHRPVSIDKFRVFKSLNRNVVLLRLFPSIHSETVAHFLKAPIRGVVLQTYGAGNMPSNRKDLVDMISEATKRGVIIVNVTQCARGCVSGTYETGKALSDAGVIPGSDMTPEAALSKLSYVLAKEDWSLEKKRIMLEKNIAGELTVLKKPNLIRGGREESPAEFSLIATIAKALHLNTSEELNSVQDVLFPSILCSAAFKGSKETLELMKEFGAHMAVADYDRRTPLHVAASEGNLEMVEYLMQNGASVHARDRNDDTPLDCAIACGFSAVVERLVACGAHLQASARELGELLCAAARKGRVPTIDCYRLAGANLSVRNWSDQTALHAAVETGRLEVVEYLLKHGADTEAENVYGQTPLHIAQSLRRPRILELLRQVPV